MTRTNENGFTVTEVIITVIILSAVMAFAIPRFQKSVERSYERDALTQLRTIHAANRVYKIQNGNYWPPTTTAQDITAINDTLGINIIANGMTYTCRGDGGTGYVCTATRDAPAPSFTVELTEDPLEKGQNPSCVSGACPS